MIKALSFIWFASWLELGLISVSSATGLTSGTGIAEGRFSHRAGAAADGARTPMDTPAGKRRHQASIWEQVTQKVYYHPNVHVRPGDVVIDCGAHIGGFTRVALSAGARMVIAIEPQRGNLLAFEKNLAQELKTGKVKLIRKGVWDSIGKLA